MAEEASNKVEEPEFKWGKKRSVGGKKKNVQFYESFTYDGVDYTLHDSVYLYKEGEPEPYIGKLIKIWENADKTKRVKVVWYFRPCEIRNFLEGCEVRENELFLACGEGLGLSNINPLEAIAGKCSVVCISKDSRNPQPSDEELQSAEFVFYRFFDVGQRKILDKIDDKIAGVEVKNIFNNLDRQKPIGIVKLGLDKKEISGNVTKSNKVVDNSQPMIDTLDGKCSNALVKENDASKPLLGVKPSINVKEENKSNDAFPMIASDKIVPQAKVEENGVSKASLVKQKSSKLSHDSKTGTKMGEVAKMDDRQGNISIEKTISRPKVDSEKGECKVAKGLIGQINKGLVEENASQKEKHDVSGEVLKKKIRSDVPNQRPVSNDDDVKTKALSSSKEKYKLQRAKDCCEVEDGPSKKLKIDKNLSKLPSDKFHRESPTITPNVEPKCHATDVTRRPDVDRSKWFKGIPWEEKMKNAHERGTLVLLENLDPCLTSERVQDIIWHGFKENCTAHVIQKTAFATPHSGQAFVIFKRKETAEMVVKKLDEGCLLMSNGRPLVASIGCPFFPEKKPTFYGHHFLDQIRMLQREMKDAVSTSHCSQPNNIEYDMAMEWCLLQERVDKSWRRLSQRQGEELRKLKAKLKTKI